MRRYNPHNVARREKVNLVWMPLPYPVRGLYYRVMCFPIVLLHKPMAPIEERCVLTEELGHHFITAGNYIGPCYSIADSITVNKEERRVLRWTADHLIRCSEFKRLSKQGLSVAELADYLEVTPRLVMAKFEFMRLAREV